MGIYTRTVILFGLLLGLGLGCNRSPATGETARPAEIETAETPGQESDPSTTPPTGVPPKESATSLSQVMEVIKSTTWVFFAIVCKEYLTQCILYVTICMLYITASKDQQTKREKYVLSRKKHYRIFS